MLNLSSSITTPVKMLNVHVFQNYFIMSYIKRSGRYELMEGSFHFRVKEIH